MVILMVYRTFNERHQWIGKQSVPLMKEVLQTTGVEEEETNLRKVCRGDGLTSVVT